MSSSSVQFVLFVLYFCFIFNVWTSPHHSHDHGKHCHTRSSDGVLHIDVEHSVSVPGKCIRATCEKNLTVTEQECVPFEVKSGCKQTSTDYNKAYPDCCPVELCELTDESKNKN